MVQFIDKYALVADINKRISRNKKRKEWENIPEKRHQLIIEGQLLGELKHFLDTLEVKEVDLEKYINKYFKRWYVDLTDQGNILHSPDGQAGLMSVKKVAKHFFELGLKAQKGE